ALRDEQRSQKIALLAFAQGIYFGVINRPFYSMVPGLVVIITILVVFAVRFIVFVVVANEIKKCKPVVSGDEVDTGVWPAAIVLVKVWTTGQSISYFTDSALITFPEAAHRIPILAVPFRP